MPYDPMLVQPMRDDLTRAGVKELTTAAEVEQFMSQTDGTTLIVVNSVCGCAAGMARPGVKLALQHAHRPDRVATVFAGQDTDATKAVRGYFADFPPSSPSFALFKNGEVVHFIPRHWIEGRNAESVAADLTTAFDKFCAAAR
ncbi:MAG: BrxA/BrxB family bacilliredoxin [bacterium]